MGIAFQAVAVTTAMPAAGAALGHLDLYAWTFTLFVIGMALSTVLAGRWCDRRGPTGALQGGLVLFGLGLLLATVAPTMYVLLASRFVQGFGGGAFNVALMVLVADLFSPAARASIMTAFSVCWVLPAFIAPPVAAWLTRHLSWHWVFGSCLPIVLVTLVLTAGPLRQMQSRLQRPDHAEADPVPIWAAVLSAVGIACVQMAGQTISWRSVPLSIVGLGLLGVSLTRLMAPGFFRVSPGIPAVSWTRALHAGSFFAAEAFLPLSLVTLRQLSLFRAGLALTFGSAGWMLGSWLQARPWLRLRRDQLITLGVGLSVGGVGVMAAGTTWHWSLVVLIVGWVVASLGMGLAVASQTLAVMALSAPARLGRNTSSLQVSEAMGNAMFTGLVGGVYANLRQSHPATLTFSAVFWTVALTTTLALLASLRVGRVPNLTSGAGVTSDT